MSGRSSLATKVKPGDDDSFFDEFSTLAKRCIEEGDTAAAKGHAAAARDCYLRAACLLGLPTTRSSASLWIDG